MRLFPLIFIFAIYKTSWGSAIGKSVSAKPADRPVRSVTVAPTVSQKQSTKPEVVERHMMLGRIFNALYLQNQLANNKIDYSDVIAGVWNLKDKTVIDKISSLNVDGLYESLANLDTKFKGIIVTKIAEVESIKWRMNSVKEVTTGIRNDLIDAVNSSLIPVFIRDGFDGHEKLKGLQDDLAAEAYSIVRQPQKRDLEVWLENLATAITKCSEILKLKDWISSVKADSGSLNAFMKGVEVARKVRVKHMDFHYLSSSMQTIDIVLEKIQKILENSDGVNFDKVKLSMDQLKVIIGSFNEESSEGIPIGTAFQKDRRVSIFKFDWESKWIRRLLKNGYGLLRTLPDFKDAATQLEEVMGVWFEVDAFDRILQVADVVEAIQQVPDKSKFEGLATCLSIPSENNVISESDKISNSTKIFLSGVTAIDNVLRWKTNLDETSSELARMAENLRLKKYGIEQWMNSTEGRAELTRIEHFLNRLSTDIFSKLKQERDFVDSVSVVSEAKGKIQRIQNWLGKFNFAKPKCDTLYSFKLEDLKDFNKVAKRIFEYKLDVGRLRPFLDSLQNVIEELSKMSSPRNSTTKAPEFKVKHPEYLLEVAFATRSLEVMEEIFLSDEAIEIIVRRGEEAKKKVEMDPVLKLKFGSIWEGFDALKATLTTLQTEIKKSLAKIPLSGKEKSLEDVGKVYDALSTAPISTKPIHLHDYRRSLQEIPDPRSWIDLDDALGKLETPVSTDFKLVFANFKKVPEALEELEMDLNEFSEGSKSNRSFWNFVKKNWMCFAVLPLLVMLCIVVVWWVTREEWNYDYIPSEIAWRYNLTFMQYQDSRLPLNQRDTNGNTQLYNAICSRDWENVERLCLEGAIMDATNGPKHRTGLCELVLMKAVDWVDWFLKLAATPTVWDVSGCDADYLGCERGMEKMFDDVFESYKKNGEPKRILPSGPRPWKVLVLDGSCFPEEKIKKLPAVIRNNITWGYQKGMDLNQFTTIVVPWSYVKDKQTLILSDPMSFRLYGCSAVLANLDFFNALLDPRLLQELTMMHDYQYWIVHTFHNNVKYEDTIYNLKTDIHQLKPPLLEGVHLNILESADEDVLKEQSEWIEILKLFGATISAKIVPDTPETPPPYYSVTSETAESFEWERGACWIVYYPDSLIREDWRVNIEMYSLVEWKFLVECIASYHLTGYVVKKEGRKSKKSGGGGSKRGVEQDRIQTMPKNRGKWKE
ncbi:hypothetical protein CAEBREN_16916 [Caenorhabditis brenneri]|uniref:Domain of unknown function WSN domain-containing protein n=1 Tax=Caenorhabditis brenneri TaxID=135651 RepID=G0NIM9_CAEBE|nr:hypothetical protein CAEBREN_16916 [Caenorhabditis brenneri]